MLAKSFRNVLRPSKQDDATLIIDLPSLLKACHRFEKAMVAVGQSVAAKDLRNNIAKTEAFYHQLQKQEHHKHIHDMRTVLALEKEQGIHRYGPNGLSLLVDPSCAMGLLWIRRSIAFQFRFFQKLLDAPQLDSKNAALLAYQETLQAYHGWALQKMYVLAVKSATPPRREVLARFGGFELPQFGAEQEEAVVRDMWELLALWEPLIARWQDIFRELDLEDQRRV